MSNLAGLHDIESEAIAPPDTWLLDTIAISENPIPKNYPANLNVLVRVNWGYGSSGTLPLPSAYEAFARHVAQYVNGTRNCKRWVIGNEPNLAREWPDNQPIFPWHYAACYKLCRQAIHALPGHEADEVLIAASGPWNDELKYEGNPNGDWIVNFGDVIDLCDGALDGFSLHSYTHKYDVSLVTSSARMLSPFQNRYYEFYTYRDYCEALPPNLRHLPCYLTEANGDGPWQAVGLMPSMLQEIDSWNHSKLPKIHCVVFYRYPRYDQFYIEGRDDVIAEYQAAVARGYQSPSAGPGPTPEPPKPPTPTPPDPQPPTPAPDLQWDPRLDVRGCALAPAVVAGGETVWRVTVGRWFNKEQSDGRVNVYVVVLDENDQLLTGVPIKWFWGSGGPGEMDMQPSEIKSDPWLASQGLGAQYSRDFTMYNVAPSYGVQIGGMAPSDTIWGCGLGSIEQPDYKIHTSYYFTFQRVKAAIQPPIPPEPPKPPILLPKLIWPVQGPVTDRFGTPPARFGQIGHNGIDIAVPTGTPVLAIADGEVMYTGWDDSGYGHYVRIYHPAIRSHSFVAHLSEIQCRVGERVQQGQTIALSGSTGNSTGPHVHYELRSGDRTSYHEGLCYGYTQGRYDPGVAYALTGSPLMSGIA